MLARWFENDLLQPDRRVRPIGLVDNLLKLVVSDDVQPVHRRYARALAIGKAQAAPDGLLDENARIGGPQRNDGIEVRHVPAFLEHIYVDDDLGRLVGVLHFEQTVDHFLFLRPCFA